MQFLRANTDRQAKITLPGPFTMSQQAKNEYYKDADEMVMDYAAAVNEEARDLVGRRRRHPARRAVAAQRSGAAKRIAVKAINRALEGIKVPTVVHLCFGYAAVVPGETKPSGYSFLPQLAELGAETISIEAAQPKLDLGVLKPTSRTRRSCSACSISATSRPSRRRTIVGRALRAGLKYVAPERLVPAPDCGMKYLPREVAFGKLKAMADAAAILRRRASGRDRVPHRSRRDRSRGRASR
jgi:5-methyltetrahydropteroyltriglutamate--homocysteine methyltransferase